MGRKQTKRQQRRAKKEEGKKKKKNTAKEDDEEVQNRHWGKETFKEDKDDSKKKVYNIFRITVPENINPGEVSQVYVGSRIVRVRCPLDSRPGQTLQITVPADPTEIYEEVQDGIPDNYNNGNTNGNTATENDEEVQNGIGSKIDRLNVRKKYPTSDVFERAMELLCNHNIHDTQEAVRLAVEYGCVRSMSGIGFYFSEGVNVGKSIHVATPWLLEGAIRGNGACQLRLTDVYTNVKPLPPAALNHYWLKMHVKFNAGNYTEIQSNDFIVKKLRNVAEKSCVMCSKTDSKTVVLQQCKGCSLYCYCSETCQTNHWEGGDNHRGECKQFYILNKYHKPYAKEIRDAAISGNNHPALDKLRHKLGLSRPRHEYEELLHHNTHDGKSIDPKDYLVGRDDGTVWLGSTPDPIGSYEKNGASKNDNTDSGDSNVTPWKKGIDGKWYQMESMQEEATTDVAQVG